VEAQQLGRIAASLENIASHLYLVGKSHLKGWAGLRVHVVYDATDSPKVTTTCTAIGQVVGISKEGLTLEASTVTAERGLAPPKEVDLIGRLYIPMSQVRVMYEVGKG
jgi:hypothetical protein